MIASSLVEWDLLGKAVLNSVVFGLGVMIVAGIAVVASLRAQDARGEDHEAAFVGLTAVTVICVVAILAAIGLGIWTMTQ